MNNLFDDDGSIGIPSDFPLGANAPRGAASHHITLGTSAMQAVLAMAERYQLGAADVLGAAYLLLLSRYAAKNRFCFLFAAETGPLQPLLLEMQPAQSFLALAQQFAANRAQAAAVTSTVDFSRIRIETGFTLHRTELDQAQLSACALDTLDDEGLKLFCSVQQQANAIQISLAYLQAHFGAATITSLATSLERLCVLFGSAPDSALTAFCLLPDDELAGLHAGQHIVWRDFPQQAIHSLIELQAQQRPEAIAVCVSGQHNYSYATLNQRANQLARALRSAGLQAGGIAMVLLQRSFDLIVAQLAILKCGAAYLCLDPEAPSERFSAIHEDAQPDLIISTADFAATIPSACAARCFYLDSAQLDDLPSDNLQLQVDPRGTAYVIYTSGSTGKPKGVKVHHLGVVSLSITAENHRFDPSDRVLQFASAAFDASVCEIIEALIGGATLCIEEKADLLPGQPLANTLETRRITAAVLFPTVLSATEARLYPDLRLLITAGEKSSAHLLRSWCAPHRKVMHAYGPTEASIGSTMTEFDPNKREKVSIGDAHPNIGVYLLDEQLQPVPNGAIGEIYVGGVPVSNGYINRDQLNAVSFVVDPFATRGGNGLLYKTGDWARRNALGQLEFLGRKDRQVKFMGNRIELEEIETCVRSCDFVKDVFIRLATNANGEEALAAYVCGPNQLSLHQVRERLKQSLPKYMVPSLWSKVEVFPVAASGKIDLQQLPIAQALSSEHPQVEAELSDDEEKVKALWQAILGTSEISADAGFFDLGGTSISLAVLHQRLCEEFLVDFPLIDLFSATTVRSQAEALQQYR